MSGTDLLTDERRLFEELCTTQWLEAGFRRVKKDKGAPGIDGVRIVEFKSRLDEALSRLQVDLESWTYKPSPVRRGDRQARCKGNPPARGADKCVTGWSKPR